MQSSTVDVVSPFAPGTNVQLRDKGGKLRSGYTFVKAEVRVKTGPLFNTSGMVCTGFGLDQSTEN